MGAELVIVRMAGAPDIPAIIRMCSDFIAVSGTGIPCDPEYLSVSLRATLASPMGAIFVMGDEPNGFLWAQMYRSPLAPISIASELALWVDPEFRGRGAMSLIRAYVEWATEMGCDRASLSYLASNPIAPIYRRAGFEQAEISHGLDL